uniref:Sulfhydryl oxidase n=1 Tax=Schistosoma japonicum TaxID=6182 RepID=Q5DC50_SCHJA|nr:SJCHGC06728 protein [Schistosoma japonicum]CAX75374.1 Augmenter of liver regeneration [Schistosoma japonicum]CAX75376.1 Augmenter of liver regeneration [Schistosoma japonicum]
MTRKSGRVSVDEDEEEDIYDPKSKGFCRACVDLTKFGLLRAKELTSKSSIECPPDKVELGRATWTFLHTMAAYYPLNPTPEQQEDMRKFLHIFPQFFPCRPCAYDFQSNIILHPPKLDNRKTLSGWLCMQHNLVNNKIGKPLFDCSRVLERWRYGWKDNNDCRLPDQE